MSTGYLEQEGYDLMGAAFEVYKEQGHGLSEEIYQEYLELELGWRDIPFTSKGELKAVKAITPEHEQQLLNYMRITRRAVGYLINFGPPKSLEWKRFILSEFIPKSDNL